MSRSSGSTPAPRRPRVSRAEARSRIAAAAERLLERGPFVGLTVDALMSEAGLARTVFYRHFTDLSHVVLELLDELRHDVLDVPASASDHPTDEAVLRSTLSRTVDFFAVHHRLIAALAEAGRGDAAVEAAHHAYMTRSVRSIAAFVDAATGTAGQGDGSTTRDGAATSTHELARALNLLSVSYLLDTFGHDPDSDRRVVLDTLWTIWGRTLFPRGSDHV